MWKKVDNNYNLAIRDDLTHSPTKSVKVIRPGPPTKSVKIIRPGPPTKSTVVKPRPIPPIWTRSGKVESRNKSLQEDNKWEDLEDNGANVQPAISQASQWTESESSEGDISEVVTSYQVRSTATRNKPHRYQYSREFKLSAIFFTEQYASPRLFADGTSGEPVISKYKAAKIIGISGKVLQHWMRDEDKILWLELDRNMIQRLGL